MQIFSIYLIIYSVLAFGYLWYRYASMFLYHKLNEGTFKGKVTVIVPYFNEKPELLVKTVRSVSECYGDNEILVIDDGSPKKDCYNAMLNLKKEIDFQLIRYEVNKGKRYAQCLGFSRAKGDIIMTLDSDTLLEKSAIINLIKPFSDEKVGATTGQLELLNEKKNLLTRIQAARYWNAFNFERKSQSAFGSVICCSGPISSYRASLVKRLIPKYKNQKFMGKECTFGDDRHLTTLILKDKFKVLFVPSAKGYTDVPETLGKYLKQQIRWKKSWLRETVLVSRFMFKTGSIGLPVEIILTTLITFFSVFARVALIIGLILNPFYILTVIPMLLFMSTLHSLYLLFHKPGYFIYSLIYGFFHVLVIYWLVFVALFSFRDVRWGTR